MSAIRMGQHWPIPYADLGHPPIALWELEEANKRIRRSAEAIPNQNAIFATILEQRRLLQNAARLSKQRRRRERTPASAEMNTDVSQQHVSPSPAHEITPYPVELWERE